MLLYCTRTRVFEFQDSVFFFAAMALFVVVAVVAWYEWLWDLHAGYAVEYLDSVKPAVESIPGYIDPTASK